jgi:hypothetical protein
MKFVGWSPAVQEADTYFTIPLAERNKGAKDVLVDVCVEVRLSTPSINYHVARFPEFRYHAKGDGIGYDPDTEGTLVDYPVVLLKKTGTIFSQ